MTTEKTRKCKTYTDVRDYPQPKVDMKTMNAILQNCNAKIFLKETKRLLP